MFKMNRRIHIVHCPPPHTRFLQTPSYYEPSTPPRDEFLPHYIPGLFYCPCLPLYFQGLHPPHCLTPHPRAFFRVFVVPPLIRPYAVCPLAFRVVLAVKSDLDRVIHNRFYVFLVIDAEYFRVIRARTPAISGRRTNYHAN